MEKTKYFAARTSDIQDKMPHIVKVNQMEIGIFRVNGQYVAWRNICPHAAAPVCQGLVCGTKMPSLVYEYIYGRDQEILRCPWHSWEFDLLTGKHLANPGVKLRGYETHVENEEIYVWMNN